jgi:Fe-S cluster biogenesis protein NfuA
MDFPSGLEALPVAHSTLTPLEDRINTALDRIRPAIAADGGDVWLIRVENQTAYVQMLGACGGCAAAHLTLKNGIEAVIREDVPEITAVEAI